MKLYAELPRRRFLQTMADAAAAGWCVVWVLAGRQVHELIQSLGSAGRLLVEAGRDLEENASSVQERVVRVPVIGSFLQERFEGFVQVGRSLQESGMRQLETVDLLSLWLGLLVALLPIMFVLWVWGSRRLRWIRDASAAAHLRSDPANLEVFALRALANLPISQLQSAPALHAIRRFHEGDYAPLADLELRQLGLKAAREVP